MHSGRSIAGTTDSPTEVTPNPHPREEDIRFILKEVKDYLSPNISGEWEGGCQWTPHYTRRVGVKMGISAPVYCLLWWAHVAMVTVGTCVVAYAIAGC